MKKIDISKNRCFPLWREIKDDNAIVIICDDIECDMEKDKCSECIFDECKMMTIWNLEEKNRVLE